ncbi:zinc finger CCCH domain-containing protein 22-like [Andrographis paniculata]|uniref:zinc finger CCCH domain-containing protein 22-like n=1 Tax=Andrographis paniculata TaxID=175694 RepID=UPI0021E796BF|nr:zinc finger CCCH domain-containing protein 22-like [Andrographis paniculata]
MDEYEATKVVMTRIQSLDPDNASKIMGYILIQDQGEKEMIRLAFGPESLLLSYISQAKACLGLTAGAGAGNSPFPPRILVPNNGFHLSGPPSPSLFQRSSPRPFSYAAALNGNGAGAGGGGGSGSPSLHFYGGGGGGGGNEFPYLDDSIVDPVMSPSGRSDSMIFPYGDDGNGGVSSPHPFHRRSCSVNDAAAFLSGLEDGGGGGGGGGWRPCMYFARGFCKNGSACKFLHSDVAAAAEAAAAMEMGSPGKNGAGFDELLRLRTLQHQRFAFMAGHHPFGYHNENPRNEFSALGLIVGPNSSSRQIYLTFPADSTFKEDDVSNYFSKFGPVQDVRIPYQQKRMFGFVTFVYPETVKIILAKGNPHFVCDSRVLVKPYKEKGKILEKKQQQLERGEHSACLSPSGRDTREHVDSPFGNNNRMLLGAQEMMLRRKLEEAELQHAIELQGQRMMNLQLFDLKNQHHSPRFLPNLRSAVAPFSSPRHSHLLMNQTFVAAVNKEDSEAKSSAEAAAGEPDLPESLEHILPDNLFASPTKAAAECNPPFSEASGDEIEQPVVTMSPSPNNSNNPASSSPGITPKSCYLQMPRFSSSGQEVIEM